MMSFGDSALFVYQKLIKQNKDVTLRLHFCIALPCSIAKAFCYSGHALPVLKLSFYALRRLSNTTTFILRRPHSQPVLIAKNHTSQSITIIIIGRGYYLLLKSVDKSMCLFERWTTRNIQQSC